MPIRKSRRNKPRKAKIVEQANDSLNLRRVAMDYFSNQLARLGWGTNSLPEATEYEMVRLSNNYWLLLTLYRNNWIVRKVVDLAAIDMTRAWPKLQSDIDPDDIESFERTLRRRRVQKTIQTAIKWARLYGGSGALIAIKGHEKYLDKPLDLDDVAPQSFLGLIPFDRWVGIYPQGAVEDDPAHPADWGMPEYYECRGSESGTTFNVHASRVLRFLGPEVPTPELQAQIWWGLSIIEVIYEELRKRDNASWAMLNLLFRANIIGYTQPDLAEMLSGLGSSQQRLIQFRQMMQGLNEIISNQSMLVLPEKGDLKGVQYAFSGLDDVYTQFQRDLAGASEYPFTKLWGQTVTGLGQSNDQDQRMYEDKVAVDQDDQLRPNLDKLYPVIAVSEWGEVPDDLDFKFPSIRVLTQEEKADLADKASAPVIAAYNAGLTWKKTALKDLRQIGDLTEGAVFSNITDEEIDEAEEEPLLPGEGGGEGGEEPGGENKNLNPRRQMKRLSEGAEDAAFDAAMPRLPEDHLAGMRIPRGGSMCANCRFLKDARRRICSSEGFISWDGPNKPAGSAIIPQPIDEYCSDWYEPRRAIAALDHHNAKHITWFGGLDIAIENPVGSVRRGTDSGGNKWVVTLTQDYGYILGTKGKDGDPIDCFVGPDEDAEFVYIVHTMKAPAFIVEDEHKVMLNFSSEGSAKQAFLDNYDRPEHFGYIEKMRVGQFVNKILLNRALDAEWTESEHPRVRSGEHGGEFTSGGGGSASGEKEGKKKESEPREVKISGQKFLVTGNHEIDKNNLAEFREVNRNKLPEHVKKAFAENRDTQRVFTDEHGNYTPERKAVHAKMIRSELRGHKRARENPVFGVVGGGPGSGKTYAARVLRDSIGDAVDVNTDRIRSKMPEYPSVIGGDSTHLLQEEAGDVRLRLIAAVSKHRYNGVLDAPGSPTAAKAIDRVEKGGHTIRYSFVHRPVEEAIAAAQFREKHAKNPEDWRKVPEETIRASHAKARAAFPLISKGRETLIYDNTGKNRGEEPDLIYHRLASGEVLINDREKVERFRKNGNEIPESAF